MRIGLNAQERQRPFGRRGRAASELVRMSPAVLCGARSGLSLRWSPCDAASVWLLEDRVSLNQRMGGHLFARLPLTPRDGERIAHGNAERVLAKPKGV